ncbi:hypothetical protein DL771_003979 [Monosporascus sp. 5C6A]|nr:hypothetical protein DL771_003979 [Monosporascus sp. 5C6A]
MNQQSNENRILANLEDRVLANLEDQRLANLEEQRLANLEDRILELISCTPSTCRTESCPMVTVERNADSNTLEITSSSHTYAHQLYRVFSTRSDLHNGEFRLDVGYYTKEGLRKRLPKTYEETGERKKNLNTMNPASRNLGSDLEEGRRHRQMQGA